MSLEFGSRITVSPSPEGGSLPPAPNPSATPPNPSSISDSRGGVADFPRHYGNLRWRIWLAHRGVDPSWGYHLPEEFQT